MYDKKMIYFSRREALIVHFLGGRSNLVLGIILTVTTASEDVTTAEDCTCSGNSLPLQEHILPLLIR
jgi:hypothetical protein